jgi:hypothetical protein
LAGLADLRVSSPKTPTQTGKNKTLRGIRILEEDMTIFIVGPALLAGAKAVECSLRWVRQVKEAIAGSKRGDLKGVVQLELCVTPEQFDRIVENPDVFQGLYEARLQRFANRRPNHLPASA